MEAGLTEGFPSLNNQTAWQKQKLEAIGEAAAIISSSLDLDQMLSRLTDIACRIMEFKHSLVLVCDRKREVQFVSSTYPSRRPKGAPPAVSLHLLVDDNEMSQLMELTHPVYVDRDESLRLLFWRFTESRNPPQDVMLVPLAIDGTRLGAIVLINRTRKCTPTSFELDIAALLGSFAASAIRNALAAQTLDLRLLEILERGKREWEQTFDAISDGIYITNADNTIIRANKSFAATFDKQLKEVIGKRCHEVVWGSRHLCAHCPHGSQPVDVEAPPTTRFAECVVKGMTSQITGYPVVDDKGEISAVVHVMKDLTEQKQLQELFVRSENLRVIGEMASGIAHDFNNLLSSIIGWSEIMLLDDLPPRLRQSATAIHRAAVDGAETVRRIQEYTRIRKDTFFATVDVNEVVRGALELARPRWKDGAEKSGITISVSSQLTDIPIARGSASDLREVFLNIILNSVDALPNGGEISVTTGRQADRVYASISDNGIGMTEEVRSRVFDPFFTTKGSTGSGLGLSIAFGIVARHGGDLTVESTPGEGSTFTVYLSVASPVEEEQDIQASHTPLHARILLIDDDQRVLEAVRAMLESEGHSVTTCLGGEAGVEAFGKDSFDIVITDVGMPQVNGWEVAARVKASSPDTVVVFLTGWGAEIATEHLVEMDINAIIHKPCRLEELRRTISAVLSPDAIAPDGRLVELDNSNSDSCLRILVVDDHKWLGEALRERLELDGHSVFLARSGRNGLQALEELEFDLVLCDFKLPDISGLEVATRIKQTERRPFLALMTGNVGALSGALSSQHEVDGVLPKPWKDTELQEVLDKSAERRRRS